MRRKKAVYLVFLQTFDPFWVFNIFGNFLQDFNFIEGRFQVVRRAFLNFYGYICIIFKILSNPDRGEMSPPYLLDHNISFQKNFSHMNRVISSNFIILDALVLTMMLLIQLSEIGDQIGPEIKGKIAIC